MGARGILNGPNDSALPAATRFVGAPPGDTKGLAGATVTS